MSGRSGIEIVYTGLRPGEKLSEELFSDVGGRRATSNALVSAVDVPPIAPQIVLAADLTGHAPAAEWMGAAVDTEGTVPAS
jgi:FlaA1/EpsC-like NDP-sugar epimerase